MADTGKFSTVANIDASQRMLFVGTDSASTPIAYSTNANLSFSKDTVDTSNKADAGWATSLGGKKSAELSVDSLCTKTGTGDEKTLFEAFEGDTTLYFDYCYVTITEYDDGTTDIVKDTTKVSYTGQLKISQIELTSDNGEVSKFSVTASSQGKVKKVDGTTEEGE